MYKIGDKVETPIGIGVVKYIDRATKNEDEGFDTLYVSIKGTPEIEFNERHITPYRTAHEKLIELWWEEEQETTIKNNKRYDKGNDTIYIDLVKKTYEVYGGYEPCKVDLTFSRILTQYLEELE